MPDEQATGIFKLSDEIDSLHDQTASSETRRIPGMAPLVPMNRISAIANGNRAITPDTAVRLARYFETSPQNWLNLQNAYDLETADRAGIERRVLPRNAA